MEMPSSIIKASPCYVLACVILYSSIKFFSENVILVSNFSNFTIPVSIMLPIFNKIEYLNRSINSAQNQTFRNIEIVCVDDCSTDASTEFIINKMKSDFRIKLVQNYYNQGTCLTRINGIFSTAGDYIISLDPDDFLIFNSTEIIYKEALKLNADVLEYRIRRIHPTRRVLDNWYPCSCNYTGNEEILAKLQKFSYRLVGWNTNKKIIRGSIYKKAMKLLYPFVSGKKILTAEDLLHCGSIFLFIKNFYCTQILAYVYYMKNRGSASSGQSQSSTQSMNQPKYVEAVVRYFYKERNSLDSICLEKLLKNKTVLDLYNNITNVNKTIKKNCNIKLNGFFVSNYSSYGFCIMMSNFLYKRSFHLYEEI